MASRTTRNKRVDVRIAKAADNRAKFFLPFQERWINDSSRIKIWEKARQLGASWTNAYRDARELARAGAKSDIWISSRDQTQSQLYIADVRKFARILEKVSVAKFGARVLQPLPHESSLVVEFANGRKATALGSNADAQAGKRGHRVLDEFALNRDPKHLYAIAYPGITWGGGISIISTHRGSANYFNTLIKEVRDGGNPKGVSLHSTPLSLALEQGFLEKLQLKLPDDDPRKRLSRAEYFDYTRNGCPDQETFDEEFECKPSDDAAAFLGYDLITPCEYGDGEYWEEDLQTIAARGNPLFLGLDIGRTRDLTAFWLLEKVADIFFTRALVVMEKQTFAAQRHQLDDFMRLPNLQRVCIDKNGIGMQIAEEAKRDYGYRVEEVLFTNESKAAMAYPVREMFEKGSIRIPNDRAVRADLHSVRKVYTEANNIRFAGDRGANGHADRFWGLALARHAAGKPDGFFATLIA